MDSGNSGSISSSGDEEYDSRVDHTLLPSTFLNQPAPQFGSISHPQSSLVSSPHHHHHPSLFDLSSSYLNALSQSHPNPNSFPNFDTATSQARRSEPGCTDPAAGVSSSSTAINQCLLGPQGLGHCVTDPSLQLRPVHDDDSNNNARGMLSSPPTTNVVRNSKKRTRASRRAPTTVLTTDTSNFRAMVQEFTGIPAPPFSGSSYSRRLDLLAGSSTLRSSASHHHLDTTSAFSYPLLRPSPQKLNLHHHQHHHQNPLLLSSSSPPSPSTLLHNNNNNNMVDAIASTTNNISSSATVANNSSSNNNYQLPPDLGLPYNHPQQNIMLSMQNHPILAFHASQQPLHPFGTAGGFSAKSQAGLSVQSLEDLGVGQGQVNVQLGAGGVSVPTGHGHVGSEGMSLRGASDDGCSSVGGARRDALRSFDGSYGGGKVAAASGSGGGGSCNLNFSASASRTLSHDKTSLENNNSSRGEGGGAVDSWICSSD